MTRVRGVPRGPFPGRRPIYIYAATRNRPTASKKLAGSLAACSAMLHDMMATLHRRPLLFSFVLVLLAVPLVLPVLILEPILVSAQSLLSRFEP